MRRLVLLLAYLLGPAVPVLAQSTVGPPTAPSRDVAVTYRTDSGDLRELETAYLAAEGKWRTETPSGATIRDDRNGRLVVLITGMRMYLELPLDERRTKRLSLPQPGERAARERIDRVAGHDCTVWRIETTKAHPEDRAKVRRSCITADGVPLRLVEGEGEDRRITIAIRVVYARQDPARFDVPKDYRPFDPSAFTPHRALPALGSRRDAVWWQCNVSQPSRQLFPETS